MLMKKVISSSFHSLFMKHNIHVSPISQLNFNLNKYCNFTQNAKINIYPQLLSSSFFTFTTSKKPVKSHQKQGFKLKKTKLDPKQNVFILYDGQRQQNSFKIISGFFLLVFGLTLVKIYYAEERKDDVIVLCVILGSFFVYQRRILKTLKKVTLNPNGDTLNITTFNMLGKGDKTLEAPVQIMTGVYKATRFGGYLLKGGGNSSLYKQMKFCFNKQYITDEQTFQYVAQGKIPRITDQYQTL